MVNVDGERGALSGTDGGGVIERSAERGKGYKRSSCHLVAKALELDSDVNKVDEEGGSFYDCNICLEVAREHPKARRVESARQYQVTNGLSYVPNAETLRRIRISIGAIGDQTEGASRNFRFEYDLPEVQNGEAACRRCLRVQRVSRVLSESAASLSSFSSALSNAERLIEDLETVMNNRFSWIDSRGSSVDIGNNPLTSDFAIIQSDHQPSDSSADLNSALAISYSSQTGDFPSPFVHILAMRTSSEINLPAAPSSSASRRRRVLSRVSNVDNQDSRESKRRRLSGA
ncbi:putative GPI-anchored adhesin-like protein PGA55 [Forsythia ovata]|uniref:GPI-anchored adhesin-like protein PGA55 n=1 Tax=Forsythia ovata TaxID=205694 RepID=A0ABD1SJQ5_9LAMI